MYPKRLKILLLILNILLNHFQSSVDLKRQKCNLVTQLLITQHM